MPFLKLGQYSTEQKYSPHWEANTGLPLHKLLSPGPIMVVSVTIVGMASSSEANPPAVVVFIIVAL